VIGDQEDLAQVGLPVAVRDLLRQIERSLERQLAQCVTILAVALEADLPRPLAGRRRIAGPVVVRPLQFVVVGIAAEVENVVLRDVARSLSLVRDLAAGIRHALANWELRRVLAVTVVFNIFGFPFTAMIPILGREQLGLTPSLVGFLSSLEGAGAFAGGMTIAMWAKPAHFGRIFLGGVLVHLHLIFYLSILAAVAGGPNHSFVAASMTLAVMGFAMSGFAAMQSTLTYVHTAPEYRSRVLGAVALCIGTGPLGFLNLGWLAENYGLPAALAIMSLEGLFAMLLLWYWGVLRR